LTGSLFIVVRGGLLLVAAGLSAGAIGELMGVGKEKAILKYLAGGPCILVVAVDKIHPTTSELVLDSGFSFVYPT
jgi:hypothetical protein